MNAPHHLTHFIVRSRRNRACIQDDELGVSGMPRLLESAVGEKGFDSCPIGLRRTASEILHEELCACAH
jgi:hypothetical protein